MVGSHVLANVCATTKYGGVVAACGLAGGMDFPATVAPFILRGVTLAGIDSVMCPRPDRLEAWSRLAHDLEISKLEAISQVIIGLDEAIPVAASLLAGKVRGREENADWKAAPRSASESMAGEGEPPSRRYP